MSGENRELRIVVSTKDHEQWHPGWRRAAEAELANQRVGGGSWHDWLMAELREEVHKTVAAWAERHRDQLSCEPDVLG